MIGTVLAGRFKILELTAEGGMSIIYLALDQQTGENVAVKVNKLGMKDEADKLFEKEAGRMMGLSNPYIVKTLGSGKYKDRAYIVFEFIKGDDLATMLSVGVMDAEDVIVLGQCLLKGLAYAHSKGIIHKDIKPENVLFRDGSPVIIDFGIAEHRDDDQPDKVMGSVHYFSPEQAAGKKVDKRTDIYSMGVMLYEVATGVKPFTSDDGSDIALMHMHKPPTPPSQINPAIPESLSAVILKAMSKDPAHRYTTAGDMNRELSACAAGYRPQRTGMKKVAIAVIAVMALLTTVVLSLLSNTGGVEEAGKVYMPSLVSLPIDEAALKLRQLDIEHVVQFAPSTEYAEGVVISQNPVASATLDEGDRVTLVVSSEQVTLSMPSLIGFTIEAAISELEELGLEVVVEESSVDGYSNGAVIAQEPAPDINVQAGSTVTITVNSGQSDPLHEIADYTGIPATEATAAISKAGISNISVIEIENPDGAPGTVLEQSIPAGLTDSNDITLQIAASELPLFDGTYFMDDIGVTGDTDITVTLTAMTEMGGVQVKRILYRGQFDDAAQYHLLYGDAGIPFSLRRDDSASRQIDVTAEVNGRTLDPVTVTLSPNVPPEDAP